MTTDKQNEWGGVTAHDVLDEATRERLGLGVAPPARKSDVDVARMMQIPVDEYRELRGIRNIAEYREAEARILALRQAKAEVAEERARKQARDALRGE